MTLHLCITNDDHDVWFLRYQPDFLSFWAFFALLPTNNPENQNFEKMKKFPGHIILQMRTVVI